MKLKIATSLRVAIGASVLALAAASAQAHHSFSAEFTSERGELTGVVTQVRFSNPHVRYYIDVTREDGTVENWELQASAVTALRPQGWTADSVVVGDVVTVEGSLGRNDAKKLFIRGMETADGRKVGAAAGANQRNEGTTVYASPDTDYTWGEPNEAYPIDITGPWTNRYKFRSTVDDLEPKPTPYTAEGRALREANDRYDDPALRCIALGLPRLFGSPYNMSIYDAGNHYLFLYVEHNSPRRIWMDGRTPDANTPATSNGFSVGRWEGDELVIETTHLLPGWLDGSGLPMSGEGTRLEERYTFAEDRLSMDRVMTIHDPLYTQPQIRRRGSARGDDMDIYEQDSCDPATYYLDLYNAGLLEEHLEVE